MPIPSNPYIISPDESISYRKAGNLIIALSDLLTKMGIGQNSRIAIHSPNSPGMALLIFATIHCGAVAVPLNIRLPDEQIDDMLKSINCRILISTADIMISSEVNVINLCEIYSQAIGEIAGYKSDVHYLFDNIGFDQQATIVFTSGSSGKPKAVLHTFGNHYYSALGSNEHIPFDSDDKWLLSLPLYHVGGLAVLFRAMLAGGAVVIAGESPIENVREAFGITHISLVSTQFIRLMEGKKRRKCLSKLKAVLLGGGPLPTKLIEKAIDYGISIYQSYGLTEMSSQVATTSLHKSKYIHNPGILKYRDLRIAKDSEILVRGETLFKGYIDKDSIDLPTDTKGWFHTADIGELDENGGLIVNGRKDNMFISGGENIHPEEIEKALLNIDSVHLAIVVPIVDLEFGSCPVAYVDMATQLDENMIKRELSSKLAKFKIPIRFLTFPEMYKQAEIKPDRKHLTDLANINNKVAD